MKYFVSPKTWGFQSCITIFSEDILSFWLFHRGGLYHIETNILICFASQWTSFYIKGTSVMKEFKGKKECLKKVNKSDNFCFIKLRKINVNLLFVKCREKLTLTFYWCLLVSSFCSSFVVTPQWEAFQNFGKVATETGFPTNNSYRYITRHNWHTGNRYNHQHQNSEDNRFWSFNHLYYKFGSFLSKFWNNDDTINVITI